MENRHPLLWTIDGVSVLTVSGVFAGLLPVLAAGFTLLWVLIQIWESKTIQSAMANWRMRRKARKLRGLEAKKTVILARIAAIEKVRVAKVEAADMVEQAKTIAQVRTVIDAGLDVDATL